MGHIRTKRINGNNYLYEQKSVREGDKVRSKHVRYIGGGSDKVSFGSSSAVPKKQLTPEQRKKIELITAAKREIYSDVELKHAIKASAKLAKKGLDTKSIYYNEDTGKYTAERRKHHEKIIHEFDNPNAVAKKGKKPVVILLGGAPASGKSTVIMSKINIDDYVVVDSDAIKQKFPEYKGYNATLFHEESSDVFDELWKKAAMENKNIILDATLKNVERAKEKIKGFKDLGYETRVYATNVPLTVNLPRAAQRAKTKIDPVTGVAKYGRTVPIEYIAEHTETINNSVVEVAPFADQYAIYSTDVPRGAPPILISESS